jgi:amidohydrolase
MDTRRPLLDEARELSADLTDLRRELHRHPELSGHEQRTMERISQELKTLGIVHETGVAGTGIVGLIEGPSGGPCIALRADMDALPVSEATGLSFASEEPGVMHACGHDVHMTCLTGAAKLLLAHRAELAGTVKLLFQPSEEMVSGAWGMIEAGVLSNPTVTACVGFHVTPHLDTPYVSFGHGARMAGTGTFGIRIIGTSGHAAQPHQTIDPVPIAAEIILALQTIASRRIAPLMPVVVSIGKIHGGTKCNIVAPDVKIEGTFRFFDPALRERVPALIREAAEGIASAMGARAEVRVDPGTPPLRVNDALTDRVVAACRAALGEGHVHATEEQTMGGEDFAFFAERVPSVHYWLGARSPGSLEWPPLHSPLFDIDEHALHVGAASLAACALELLRTP